MTLRQIKLIYESRNQNNGRLGRGEGGNKSKDTVQGGDGALCVDWGIVCMHVCIH